MVGWHALDQLHLVGEERRDARGCLRDGAPSHAPDRRRAAPVGRVRFHHHRLVAHEAGDPVRAGANRAARELFVADLPDVGGWHDVGGIAAHARRQQRVRSVGRDAHGERVDDRDAGDRADIRYRRRARRGVEYPLQRELHRLGVEFLTIGEAHAAAQAELPGRVVNRAPGLGEARHQAHLRVAYHQRVEDVVDHGRGLAQEAGIERVGRDRSRDNEIGGLTPRGRTTPEQGSDGQQR